MIWLLPALAIWLLGVRSHYEMYSHYCQSYEGPQFSDAVIWGIASIWPIIEFAHCIKLLIYGEST